MKPLKVIIIGTGRLACACLESCLLHTENVECVEPENAAFSTLRSLCAKRGVKYYCLLERDALKTFFLGCASPTLVVSAYNSFIFPKPVLASPWLTIVNFHNSLLPRHRGRNAPTWTIFEMDDVTGITWHRVTQEIDQGEIICQRDLKVPSDVTAINLTQQTLDLGAEAFREILASLLDGTHKAVPGDRRGEETLHRSSDVPNAGILDLSWSLPKVYAFLRSLDYGKAKVFAPPRVHLLGKQFVVLGYHHKLEEAIHPAGNVIEVRKDQLILCDGGHCLKIQFRQN